MSVCHFRATARYLRKNHTQWYSVYIVQATFPEKARCLTYEMFWKRLPVFFYSSRLVMLRRLTPNVDRLCSMAEVAGGRTPATPRPIKPPLNPMTKR